MPTGQDSGLETGTVASCRFSAGLAPGTARPRPPLDSRCNPGCGLDVASPVTIASGNMDSGVVGERSIRYLFLNGLLIGPEVCYRLPQGCGAGFHSEYQAVLYMPSKKIKAGRDPLEFLFFHCYLVEVNVLLESKLGVPRYLL